MKEENLIVIILAASAGYLVPMLWKRIVGTRYRTERDCQNCATKLDIAALRSLVIELAIKAGVSHKVIAGLLPGPHRREDVED